MEVLEVVLTVKREIRVTRGRLKHQICSLQSHQFTLLSLLYLQLHQRLQDILRLYDVPDIQSTIDFAHSQ